MLAYAPMPDAQSRHAGRLDLVIVGPHAASSIECEAVLRSLPEWFGIEASLVQYTKDAEAMPTFTAHVGADLYGFLTVKRHFAESAEVHCIAVAALRRGRGVGRALMAAAESWLVGDGVRLLQVKTLGPSHPSTHYAETRRFYERAGFAALEEFKTLWGHNPCLQLAKALAGV